MVLFEWALHPYNSGSQFQSSTVFQLTWSLHSVHCSLLPDHGKSVEVYFTLEHSFTYLHYATACSVFTHRLNLLEKCEVRSVTNAPVNKGMSVLLTDTGISKLGPGGPLSCRV